VGHTHSELEASVKQSTITTFSNAPLQIVMKVHGFKAKRIGNELSDSDGNVSSDSEKDEAIKFTGRYNATKFVQIRTTISKEAVKKKPVVKKEKEEKYDDKGGTYSMEVRLNSVDFHHISSIKLTSRDETPGWYSILVAHGEMCGLFIPPWDSVVSDLVMGRYWSKKIWGETIHGRCRTMESHVHKLLLTDGIFSKDCDDEYHDIVKASDGNGYAALHNILQLHHPCLTEKKVETQIPTQSVGMRFGHHIRAIQRHLFREETRRTYSKYEALQLVMETLHPSYHLELIFCAEKNLDKHTISTRMSLSSCRCRNSVQLLSRGQIKCG
jgi:hypothetical protein